MVSHSDTIYIAKFSMHAHKRTHPHTPTHTHIHIQVKKLETGFSWSRSIVKTALFLTLCIFYEPP